MHGPAAAARMRVRFKCSLPQAVAAPTMKNIKASTISASVIPELLLIATTPIPDLRQSLSSDST
jgi:hypothetical protein